MSKTIKVRCENNGSEIIVGMGTTLSEVINILSLKNRYPFLAAYVNNKIKELDYAVYKPISVRFIDITHFEGSRVYQRTLFFVLSKAVRDLYPDRKFYIRHSVSKGFYCEIEGRDDLSQDEIDALKKRMRELIEQDIPIVTEKVPETEAREIYERLGYDDKLTLLDNFCNSR